MRVRRCRQPVSAYGVSSQSGPSSMHSAESSRASLMAVPSTPADTANPAAMRASKRAYSAAAAADSSPQKRARKSRVFLMPLVLRCNKWPTRESGPASPKSLASSDPDYPIRRDPTVKSVSLLPSGRRHAAIRALTQSLHQPRKTADGPKRGPAGPADWPMSAIRTAYGCPSAPRRSARQPNSTVEAAGTGRDRTARFRLPGGFEACHERQTAHRLARA